MRYILLFLLLSFLLLFIKHQMSTSSYEAIVIVPVADLVTAPLQKDANESSESAYNALPISGGNPHPSMSCPRMHQLLFHEIVRVIQEQGDEVQVEIPNFFYTTETDKTPQHTFWTLKKNLIPLQKLKNAGLDVAKLPPPISYKKKNNDHKNVITLAMPYQHSKTDSTFSAGTRFIRVNDGKSLGQTIDAYLLDPHKLNFDTIQIPSSIVIVTAANKEEKIKQFIATLQRWAHLEDGFIPYVWGGCSFTQTNNKACTEIKTTIKHEATTYFTCPNLQKPYAGFSCSNVIARAAQICGIPFFFRYARTVQAYMKPLQKNEKLEDGDIITSPYHVLDTSNQRNSQGNHKNNHVMVISSVQNSTLIEARGYRNGGSGRVQEIKLNSAFKDISTYEELTQSYYQEQPIVRLGSNGQPTAAIEKIKLFKLKKLWD